MIRTLKWVYTLGYEKARSELFALLEREYQFHSTQAEVKYYREKDVKEITEKEWLTKERRVSSKDHEQRLKEVQSIQTQLDPKRYPDTNSFLEMLR